MNVWLPASRQIKKTSSLSASAERAKGPPATYKHKIKRFYRRAMTTQFCMLPPVIIKCTIAKT